jgi:hypothetical protein
LLLVEGELDEIVLTALLGTRPGRPAVERGGSKDSLKPQARDRRKTNPQTCYLRDRDFDFDSPTDLTQPSVDAEDTRSENTGPLVLGFRWCRHAIESYLLEPRLVAAATGWAEADYSASLLDAANHIQHYTAARWAVGVARRSLPPFRELATRPDFKNEIKLPPDCSQHACHAWARDHVEAFRSKVETTLSAAVVQASLEERGQRLANLTSAEEVLLWHAGKDLLAALAPKIAQRRPANPKAFCRTLRDWVRQNPERALQFFPEWQRLLIILQS